MAVLFSAVTAAAGSDQELFETEMKGHERMGSPA